MQNGSNVKVAIALLKTFPLYSDNNFFLVLRNELVRVELNVVKVFQPEKHGRPCPSDRLITSKINIIDFVQCDESHIAVMMITK